MSKKQIIIFCAIAIFLAVCWYFTKPFLEGLYSSNLDIEGLEEIKFEDSLFIQHKSYLIDGKKKVSFNCTIDGNELGYIRWKDEVAKLICVDDYLGGVKLIFNANENEIQREFPIDISQRDGDAGDSWDMRGVIERQASGGLRIEVLNLMSTMEVEQLQSKDIICRSYYTTLVWSESSNKFLKAKKPKRLVTANKFDPPTRLLKDCANAMGEWQDGPANIQ